MDPTDATPLARNAAAEATALLPAGHTAAVLEPSPPANTDSDWYADDPTDPAGALGTLVTPIPGEGMTWEEIAADRPDLRGYVDDHWLGSSRRLAPVPQGFDATRRSQHKLAFFAVAPARYAATGKLGLRYTHLGFGTPFIGDDEQIRVESGLLVHQAADQITSTSPTNVAEACEFLGIPYRESWFEDFRDPLPPDDPTVPLTIDTTAANAIGDWFGFATLTLERSRRTSGAEEVTRVQLWPEHFDPAFEMGSYEKGHRASYGASPGDDNHPEPYLYIAAWGEIDKADRFWNDATFNGASLAYRDILESGDQLQAALDFYRRGYEKLVE